MPDLADQNIVLGDNFVADDYIDVSLKADVCLICALPLTTRKQLEEDLFQAFDKKAVAEKYGLVVEDIDSHINNCILDRDSTIPVSDLIGKLLKQINSFVVEIDRFRIMLNTERNSDSIIAYTGMMREMRMTVDSLSKMTSPTKIGEQIKLQTIKPLIYLLIRSMLEQLGGLRQVVLDSCPTEDRGKLAEAFKSSAKSWGELASEQNIQSLTKLCEILGIDKRELIG